eukprot:3087471-Rhodomonas_salina.6
MPGSTCVGITWSHWSVSVIISPVVAFTLPAPMLSHILTQTRCQSGCLQTVKKTLLPAHSGVRCTDVGCTKAQWQSWHRANGDFAFFKPSQRTLGRSLSLGLRA